MAAAVDMVEAVMVMEEAVTVMAEEVAVVEVEMVAVEARANLGISTEMTQDQQTSDRERFRHSLTKITGSRCHCRSGVGCGREASARGGDCPLARSLSQNS